MEIAKYTTQFQQWFNHFFAEKEPTYQTPFRCCIEINAGYCTLIKLKIRNHHKISFIETIPVQNETQLTEHLMTVAERYDLFDIPMYWLLSPNDYQIFLIESLPVKQDEMREALTWRIRSLINFPIEEAVIDFFSLPAKKKSPENPMLAVAVSRSAQLRKYTELFSRSGLLVTTIDIPELAIRNLTSLVEDDEKSTAFVFIYDTTLLLNITRQKTLYFTRRINHPKSFTQSDFESIGLEILRYFDYFQSQWRYPSPTRIFISASNETLMSAIKALSEYLSARVEIFPVEKLPPNLTTHLTNNHEALAVYGCLLREEVEYAEATA